MCVPKCKYVFHNANVYFKMQMCVLKDKCVFQNVNAYFRSNVCLQNANMYFKMQMCDSKFKCVFQNANLWFKIQMCVSKDKCVFQNANMHFKKKMCVSNANVSFTRNECVNVQTSSSFINTRSVRVSREFLIPSFSHTKFNNSRLVTLHFSEIILFSHDARNTLRFATCLKSADFVAMYHANGSVNVLVM